MSSDQLKAHLEFFEELGVDGIRREPEWRGRSGGEDLVPVFSSPEAALKAIRADLGDCTRCKLHTLGRKQIVYGVGNPNADLMLSARHRAPTRTSRASRSSAAPDSS